MLCDRKKRILQFIIDDYVSTAEPIGSRTIAKKYELGLSPATIRNEMADLEEMGYLQQPHTSAGRVPSDKGYRLYVDELMTSKNLTSDELDCIKNTLVSKITAIEQMMKQVSGILSQITHYTSVAVISSIKKNIIRHIQIIPLDSSNALLVIVTGTGVVKNSVIKLSETVNNDFITRFSNILSEKLSGLTIESITLPVIQDIQNEMGSNKDLLMPILDTITMCINNIEDNEVYVDGASNILEYPEYSSIDKARRFMSAIEERDTLCRLIGENDENVRFSIGRENFIEEMDDCSLISTSFSIGGRTIGKVGIIGPKRMDYPKVVSSVNAVRNELYSIFENWLFK